MTGYCPHHERPPCEECDNTELKEEIEKLRKDLAAANEYGAKMGAKVDIYASVLKEVHDELLNCASVLHRDVLVNGSQKANNRANKAREVAHKVKELMK